MRHYPHPAPKFNRTPGMSRTGRALKLVQDARTAKPNPIEAHVAMVLCATPEQVTERFTRLIITNYPGVR